MNIQDKSIFSRIPFYLFTVWKAMSACFLGDMGCRQKHWIQLSISHPTYIGACWTALLPKDHTSECPCLAGTLKYDTVKSGKYQIYFQKWYKKMPKVFLQDCAHQGRQPVIFAAKLFLHSSRHLQTTACSLQESCDRHTCPLCSRHSCSNLSPGHQLLSLSLIIK